MLADKRIEEFLMAPRSEAKVFEESADEQVFLDVLIERLKSNLRTIHKAELPKNLKLLRSLYERLIDRHRLYSSEDLIADAVLHFLAEENRNKSEGLMEIVRLAGDEDIFSPCQSMATAIVELLKAKGECHPADIEAKGFSFPEIKRYWSMAYSLAKVEMNWMDV